MPMPSKSRTTTSRRSSGIASASMRRLPTHRPPTSPGEMLQEEFLAPLGLTQTALAAHLGVSYPRLHDILHAKRAVTADTALRLARVTGMSAEFWLGLQQDWDLWQLRHARVSAVIARLQPLVRRTSRRSGATMAPRTG